jgi:hypothetical protein
MAILTSANSSGKALLREAVRKAASIQRAVLTGAAELAGCVLVRKGGLLGDRGAERRPVERWTPA